MKKTLIVLSVVALLGAAPAGAQLDFSRFVALGDATTAGFTHLSIQDCYQENSWPAVLARQADAEIFEMPLVSAPGIPAQLQLVGFDFSTGSAVPIIVPISDDVGIPYNIEYPGLYNNLAVPTANLYDLLFTTGNATDLLNPEATASQIFHGLVLRFPTVPGTDIPAPAIAQAIGLDPTFVTLWTGNDDVLDAIITGTAIDGVTMTPTDVFALLYPQAVANLVALTSADIVLMTVIDVTEIAFATTLPPFVEIPGIGLAPLVGTNGPLTPDSRVTLGASELIAMGWGLPIPGSPPLPDDLDFITGTPGVVLRPPEIEAIKERVNDYNAIIRATGAAFGLPVFDAGDVIDRANFGEPFMYGGIPFDGEFLLGGLTGFDGIYQQQIGHGVFAVKFIDFLNDEFDADIDQFNLAEILYSNPCAVPIPMPVGKADEVVFSTAAHRRLVEIFAPQVTAASSSKPPAEESEPAPRRRSGARRRAP
jgi:hypothetical protein